MKQAYDAMPHPNEATITVEAEGSVPEPFEDVVPGAREDDEQKIIQRAYRRLLRSIQTPIDKADRKSLREAFELAATSHGDQRRKTGEPYILHPIEVARICVHEMGLGPTAAVCALLHDVVEDTSVDIKEIVARFGERIGRMVDGLTKLDGLHESESPQAENISKVLKAMLFDVRVVLIKMADRLHNLRTIKGMPVHKQLKIAAETSTVYAPIAHRLGLYNVKTEFQDICLKITHPEVYHDIAKKLAETKRSREEYIKQFISPLMASLKEMGWDVRIHGRPKSIFSIWNKIKTKDVVFGDIYDLFAIRIITKVPPEAEKTACWHIYSIVTDHYHPITERLKDWVTNPKSNGYESLHTTVVGPGGRYVEVQIRSERMDDVAERGFAAHWKYKGIKRLASRANTFDNWLGQVRDALETNTSGNAMEFLMDFQSTLFSDEVHVFTPKGEMKIFPEGATALDFAFSIHSDVGCACRAVRINNRVAPIYYQLKNGDQIEVITDKNQKPSEDWLQHVVTGKARNRIRVALKEEKRRKAEYGKEILERKLSHFKVPVEENADMLARWYNYPSRLEFLSAIHLAQVDLSQIIKRFRPDGQRLVEIEVNKTTAPPPQVGPNEPPEPLFVRLKPGEKPQVIINNEPGNLYAYTFATCCNPVQGDGIFAYITISQGVKIHRATCPNANNLLANYAHRVLKAGWGNTAKSDFLADIVVTGIDTGPGVINQLTNCISDMGLNIRSFSISGEGGYFEGRISLIVGHTDVLQRAMIELRHFEWVTNVSRVE
jgi:GTP diphosphokinase / guanosine-3',5'-bis(diphosphate) 3'-diphosphatase